MTSTPAASPVVARSPLTVTLEMVTPLVMGGADPYEAAEFRITSLKGLIRYWYRAADPNYRVHEPTYFGTAPGDDDEGADDRVDQAPDVDRRSPFGVRLNSKALDRSTAGEAPVDQISSTVRWSTPISPDSGRAYRTVDGFNYLTYHLTVGPDGKDDPRRRRVLQPPATPGSNPKDRITLTIRPRPVHQAGLGDADLPRATRAWITGLWLLCHLGGLGTRSRRGLGSVRLVDWSGWADCSALPVAGDNEDFVGWQKRIYQGLRTIAEWYPPGSDTPDRPSLGGRSRIVVLPTAYSTWHQAMHYAAEPLRAWRVNKDTDDRKLKEVKELRSASIALPIRRGKGGTVAYAGEEHHRQASPLWIRIFHTSDGCRALYLFLDGPYLGTIDDKPERIAKQNVAFKSVDWDAVPNFLDAQLAQDQIFWDSAGTAIAIPSWKPRTTQAAHAAITGVHQRLRPQQQRGASTYSTGRPHDVPAASSMAAAFARAEIDGKTLPESFPGTNLSGPLRQQRPGRTPDPMPQQPPVGRLQNQVRTCTQCHQPWTYTIQEQNYFLSKKEEGVKEPVRCRDCRAQNRASRNRN